MLMDAIFRDVMSCSPKHGYQYNKMKDVQKGIYILDYRHLFSIIFQGFATDDL